MGTLGGGDSDGRPPDNGGQPEGLSGLPAEWGTIVIPDDPAALAGEADEIRRELRRAARRARWRTRFGLATGPNGEHQPSLGLPLLIMSIAVLATLTSLFVVAWPGAPRRADPGATTPGQSRPLPDLTLRDDAGAPVRIRTVVPAVILLVEGCSCAEFISATEQVARPDIAVLAIDRVAPSPPPGPPSTAYRLADPDRQLRLSLHLGQPTGAAAVVLVNRDGTVANTLLTARSVDAFRGELSRLRGS
jgi:hypothetical protein